MLIFYKEIIQQYFFCPLDEILLIYCLFFSNLINALHSSFPNSFKIVFVLSYLLDCYYIRKDFELL